MAFTLGATAAKDSAGSAIAGGLLSADIAGGGVGPTFLFYGIVDGLAGSNRLQVTAANAMKVDASGVAVPITDNSGSLTVDNAGTFATQITTINSVAPAFGSGVRGATVQRVTVATDDVVPASQSGTWTVQPGNTANTTPWLSKLHDGTNAVAVKAASTAPQATDPALVVGISPNSVNANGQTTMSGSAPVVLPSNQSWPTGMSPRAFVAAFTTLTRPANTTAYAAADSISDNATAGSVTALSATISDTNDDPITITDILVKSTDTGLAGKKLRAYLFNADPTASTGVGAGDNAAYSQKVNGYIGSFMGYMETGFSDGTVGRLVPTFNETNYTQAGGFVVCKPTAGAKTLYIQYQAVEAFTPSANSTTIIGTARGFQGRAS